MATTTAFDVCVPARVRVECFLCACVCKAATSGMETSDRCAMCIGLPDAHLGEGLTSYRNINMKNDNFDTNEKETKTYIY